MEGTCSDAIDSTSGFCPSDSFGVFCNDNTSVISDEINCSLAQTSNFLNGDQQTDQQSQSQQLLSSQLSLANSPSIMNMTGIAVSSEADQLDASSTSRQTTFFLDAIDQGSADVATPLPNGSIQGVTGQSHEPIRSSEQLYHQPNANPQQSSGNVVGAASWSFPSPPLSIPFETSPATGQYFQPQMSKNSGFVNMHGNVVGTRPFQGQQFPPFVPNLGAESLQFRHTLSSPAAANFINNNSNVSSSQRLVHGNVCGSSSSNVGTAFNCPTTNTSNFQPQNMPQVPFSHSRILAPLVGQCELKLIELNKMLQQRPQQQVNIDLATWWEHFVGTFFDDEAEVTFRLFVDDGPKTFSIHRVLIPRLFRSFYECGCRDLSFLVTLPRELSNGSSCILESSNAQIVAFYMRPQPVCITTECNMALHFSCCNDPNTLRIKNWTFTVSNSYEYLSREYMSRFFHQVNPSVYDMTTPCMRYGLPDGVIEFLRLAAILEPMQDLMALQKNCHLPPRQCLVTAVQERMNAPPTGPPSMHMQVSQQAHVPMAPVQMMQQPPQRMPSAGPAAEAGTASAEKKTKAPKRKRSKAGASAAPPQPQAPQQLKQEAQAAMSPAFASPQPMGSPSFFPGQQPPPSGPGQPPQISMGPPQMSMPPGMINMPQMTMPGGPSPGPGGFIGSPYQPQMQGMPMNPQQQQQQQQPHQRPMHLQLGPGGYAPNQNSSTPTQQFGGPPGSLSVHSNA